MYIGVPLRIIFVNPGGHSQQFTYMPMHRLDDFRRRGPPNALHRACYARSETNFLSCPGKRLSAMGIDNAKGDFQALTALMLSSNNGNSDAVRILLDSGADVSMVADHGNTALQLAAAAGVFSNWSSTRRSTTHPLSCCTT